MAPAAPLSDVLVQTRRRHHGRAQAVARGEIPEGPQHIIDILLGDPAFQNLVALYAKGKVS